MQTDSGDIISNRVKKIQELASKNEIVYKNKWERTGLIESIIPLANDSEVSSAGRIMSIREFGKLIFCHIKDYSGLIQIALEQKSIGDELFSYFKKYCDIADFIGVKGKLFTTKTNEKTILVTSFALLSKTMRPLPEKWHGISNVEITYRQRYLDLIMNKASMNRFKLRTKLITIIRDFLNSNSFIEVETPILQTKKSGALAKPFVTHHNAHDIDLFLRIAPETYLKRCIAGGFDRVYEFAKSFRNEGIDPSHLQEFTILEFYAAYWDYIELMKFTAQLIQHAIFQIYQSYTITYQDVTIDFSGEWPIYTFQKLIVDNCNIDIDQYPDAESLRKAIKSKGIQLDDIDKLGRGNLIDSLYKKVARPKMINPQFVINHPIDLSPLARKNDQNPLVTDRFQLVVNTWEIVNAYSELVDPIDQRQRLEMQAQAHDKGDEDAMEMDEDFLLCVEHGLPPIAGWGMGIDRLMALLSNVDNLKDVVLFPLMKPIAEHPAKQMELYPDLGTLPVNKAQALELLKTHISSESLRKHCLAAAFVMEGLAEHFKQDQNAWYILGLLHDLDFEKTESTPEKHGLVTADILKQMGFSDNAIQTIESHNCEHNGSQRLSHLDYLLSAGETITGLIIATALIYPEKKLASVQVDSVIKRMKKKDFAKNVNRETIMLVEKINLPLETFVGISLEALKKHASELGL